MGCEKCSNSAKKILDDMAERRWDDVVKLTNSACRLRTITRAALIVVAVLLCVCVFLISRTTDQEKQIHALRGDLDAVHDILDAGVVVEEWTTTESTTTETINQDTGEGNGNNVYLGGAERYAKKATQYKGMDDRLSSMYATMGAQELSHVDTLHEQSVRLIQAQRSEGKEIPSGMQAVWDWEHSHMMDSVARIKVLLDTARR